MHFFNIHTLNFAQVKSMDDNCGEWVECMGVASGCGEQEVGVASGCGCKEVYRFPHTTYPYTVKMGCYHDTKIWCY